jgi:hypothetical protein
MDPHRNTGRLGTGASGRARGSGSPRSSPCRPRAAEHPWHCPDASSRVDRACRSPGQLGHRTGPVPGPRTPWVRPLDDAVDGDADQGAGAGADQVPQRSAGPGQQEPLCQFDAHGHRHGHQDDRPVRHAGGLRCLGARASSPHGNGLAGRRRMPRGGPASAEGSMSPSPRFIALLGLARSKRSRLACGSPAVKHRCRSVDP